MKRGCRGHDKNIYLTKKKKKGQWKRHRGTTTKTRAVKKASSKMAATNPALLYHIKCYYIKWMIMWNVSWLNSSDKRYWTPYIKMH